MGRGMRKEMDGQKKVLEETNFKICCMNYENVTMKAI